MADSQRIATNPSRWHQLPQHHLLQKAFPDYPSILNALLWSLHCHMTQHLLDEEKWLFLTFLCTQLCWSPMVIPQGSIYFPFLCINVTFDGNWIQLLLLSSLALECKRKNSPPRDHQLGLISLLRTQMRHLPFWPQGSPSTKWGCPPGLSWWKHSINPSMAGT